MLAEISAFFQDTMFIWIPLILGSVFLTLGITTLRRVMALRSRGIRVPGRVTGSSGMSGNNTRATTFEFTTADGRYVHTEQSVSTSPNLMRRGRQVTVAYDPDDPERAEIIESVSQIAGAVVFTVGGCVALLAAAVITVVTLG
ncbi:uncharacterized protein DUF3592 [Murinocardiopsis flavida]|uniref:Uncharacterized protein DUF3592 n=1 Tax=Murinocardiopsis flavida TaxID=645275 RepID=A0A2P8D930_9ACTN|nr:DUF3592 domain-containing protein [Murinocardiopsis flavida]PSK93738.1 uncharacterized protein DUF3592 [Murinocardiopsis flavida]